MRKIAVEIKNKEGVNEENVLFFKRTEIFLKNINTYESALWKELEYSDELTKEVVGEALYNMKVKLIKEFFDGMNEEEKRKINLNWVEK